MKKVFPDLDLLTGRETSKLQNLVIKVDKILNDELKKEKAKYSFVEARMYNIQS